jgi:endoglycosylceramidase
VHLEKARSARLPVWIGEFGIGERAVNRDRWIDDQVQLFDRYGLGRAWWEYHGAGPFSATNRDGSWKPWVRRLVGIQSGIG